MCDKGFTITVLKRQFDILKFPFLFFPLCEIRTVVL